MGQLRFGDRIRVGSGASALKHRICEVRKPNTRVTSGGIKRAIAFSLRRRFANGTSEADLAYYDSPSSKHWVRLH